jgi:Peptidase S24-like
MGVLETLSVDGVLSDVQRMDKRQVIMSWPKIPAASSPHENADPVICLFAQFSQFFYQVLSFGMIVSSALMIWKGLMVVTGSESPIVVVLSGSMEPAFHRGDLLFLTNYPEEPVRVGEIVVFKVDGRDIPIVHRVIKLHEK